MSTSVDEMLTDSAGHELPRDEVETLARGNVRASLSYTDLLDAFLQGMDQATLLQWATDASGEFPNG